MGYAAKFGGRDTPRTYDACRKLWEDNAKRVARKGWIELGYNTELRYAEGSGAYYVTFHGHRIVTYYPEYKAIDAHGYETSPTTQGRIAALTGVTMRSNAALGFEEKVRVNGYPYFAGMRIDNFGHVFEEDRKPDHKTRPVRECQLRYATLWKRIYKYLLARWELGEFKLEEYTHEWGDKRSQQALLEVEELIAGGGTHIEYAVAMDLLFGGTTPLARDLHAYISYRKEDLRNWWLLRNDGYETIEVK